MKVAITAQGPDLNSNTDTRFGRAKYFIVFDLENDTFSAVDNVQNLHATQGAGIQAGMQVSKFEVAAVITGHVGPKAFVTLQAGGVKVYTGAKGTVAEAVEQFKSGQLSETDGADVEGHWV